MLRVSNPSAGKSIISPNKIKNPMEKINDSFKTLHAEKIEKRITDLKAKPSKELTFNEKMELAYYNTAKGLMNIKEYPPVIY